MTYLIGNFSRKEGCTTGAGGTDSVQSSIDGLLHLGLPVQPPVDGRVHRSLGGDHLSFPSPCRLDRARVSRQLGRQRDTLELLAAIAGMKHDGRLPDDPPLVVQQRSDFEPVVDLLVLVQTRERTGDPIQPAIEGLQESALRTDEPAMIRLGGVERDVKQGLLHW